MRDMKYECHFLGLQLGAPLRMTFDAVPDFGSDYEDPDEAPPRGPLTVEFSSVPLSDLWRRASGKQWPSIASQVQMFESSAPTVTLATMDSNRTHAWRLARILECLLRLSTPARIRRGAYATYEDNQDRASAYVPPSFEVMPRAYMDFTLPSSEVVALEACIRGLISHTSRLSEKEIAIALRYFERAVSTRSMCAEDRILTLTIALEALLSPSSKDELKFRIALRAARLAARNPDEASRINALCSWAYDVRSSVAHGSFDGFKEAAWKSACGYRPSGDGGVLALVEDLVRVVRLCLLLRVMSGRKKDEHLKGLDGPYWASSLDSASLPVLASVWLDSAATP